MNIHEAHTFYRSLGKTGIQISRLSFGAGPISTLMVGDDRVRQRQVVEKALEADINWFDTAATYGQGQSERNLGQVLHELGAASRDEAPMPDPLDESKNLVPGEIERC